MGTRGSAADPGDAMSRKGVHSGIAVALVVLAIVAGVCAGLAAPAHSGAFRGSNLPHPLPAYSARGQSQPVASLTISPSQITQGQSINVQTSVNGGTSPYSYSYSGLPSGCGGQSSAQFSCNPSGTGNFNVQVMVTDFNGNSSISPSQSLTVTSSNNNNGNGNGNGSGSSSNNSFSSLFSNIGGFLSLLVIFGIVGFATWVLLVVGIWIIAIVLLRRLPKRGEAAAMAVTGRCAACSAAIPSSAKFCPECGASTAPKRA